MNPTQTPTPTEPGLKLPWSIDSDASDIIDCAKTTFGRELLDNALEHARSVGRKYNGAPLIALADVQAVLAATPAPAALEAVAKEPIKLRCLIQEVNNVSGLPMWRHSSTNGDLRAALDDGWMDVNGWEPVMRSCDQSECRRSPRAPEGQHVSPAAPDEQPTMVRVRCPNCNGVGAWGDDCCAVCEGHGAMEAELVQSDPAQEEGQSERGTRKRPLQISTSRMMREDLRGRICNRAASATPSQVIDLIQDCNEWEAEAAQLREQLAAAEKERDALLAQFRSAGHVPYLERMRELVNRAESAEQRLSAVLSERGNDGARQTVEAKGQ